uniref:Uncharacterized protein n=2 Tax=Paenibacillus athensensis TaxID=1967502 RepID=A0A4Y8Q9Y3_9BACL
MKKKLFSRREKIIAAAVTAAMVTAPFALGVERPTTVGAEVSMPPTTNVDKVYDMVLPANGSSDIIDLNYLFGQEVWGLYTSSDEDQLLASIDQDLLMSGLLKVTTYDPQSLPATVSFTLSLSQPDSSTMQIEKFNVTIGLPTGADGHFDISDAVSYMNSNQGTYGPSSVTPQLVSGLLGNIGPDASTFYQFPGNRKPVATSGGIQGQGLISGNDVSADELLGNLSDYFSDPDGQMLTYYFGSSNTEVVRTYLGEGGDWRFCADMPGDATISFVATDSMGGAAYKTFNIHVDGEGSGNQAPYYYNTITTNYLYAGATIDLSDYFTDPDEDPISYELTVMNSGGTTSTTSLTGSLIQMSNIPLYGKIINVRAIDPEGAYEDMEVNISRMSPNALDTQSLYTGSSYLLDLNSVFNLGSNISYSVITYDMVDASIVDDVYLKVDTPVDGNALLHVYAYDNDNNKTYQDDLEVQVLTFGDTNGMVHIPTLFPYDNAGDIYSHMTKSTSDSTMLGTGDYIYWGGPSGGSVTFTFDPNDGHKIITVPYTKP